MQASKLEDIFLMTLKDMYHGEKQIAKALPKMAKHAESRQLKEALNHHLDETKGQLARLERVFQLMDKPVRGETCEAVKGLLEEGEELMEKAANGAVLATGGQGYRAKADPKNGIASVQKAAASPKANFELYEDKNKEHRWRLKASNGQVIASSSEAYKAKADAEKAVEIVKAGAPKAQVVEVEGK